MVFNTPIALPSCEYINEAVYYEELTGDLIWNKRPIHHFKNSHGMNTFNSNYAGKRCASNMTTGYKTISLKGKVYLAHRVIWKMITGKDPLKNIDHIDMDKTNNRFINLRLADKRENSYNQIMSPKNKVGYKGVSWDSNRNKFYACIAVNGKTKSLGRFESAEMAHQAYKNAATLIHGEFGRFE